jgi:hypothetical protein
MAATPGMYFPPPGLELPPQRNKSPVSVPFKEWGMKEGLSPVITVDGEGKGTVVERTFILAAKDVKQFTKESLGFASVDGAQLKRTMPLFDPEYDWLPATKVIHARGYNWKKFDGAAPNKRLTTADPAVIQSIARYDKALVTLQFNEVDYYIVRDEDVLALSQDPDNFGGLQAPGEVVRYVTFTTDASVDYLSIPPTTDQSGGTASTLFKFSEGPQADQDVPDAPGKPLPGESFHYRWRRVPYSHAPYANISECFGRVNKFVFFGCDPHTLLFMGKDQELVKQADGSWAVDLLYHFRFFKPGWNKVYSYLSDPNGFYQIAVNGTFQNPGSAADGKLIFDERDFLSKLFKVV